VREETENSEIGISQAVEEPKIYEAQSGTEGTVVVFDSETAAVLAGVMDGWRIIASPTPAAALTAGGALVTSWTKFFMDPGQGPWVLIPPKDPTSDRSTYALISAWLEEAKLYSLEGIRMRSTFGPPAEWFSTREPDIVRKFVLEAPPAKLPSRAPAAPRQRSSVVGLPTLDLEHACVRAPDEKDANGQVVPGSILVSGACPIVKAVEQELNDLLPGQTSICQFRLALVMPDGREVAITKPVPPSDLRDMNKWLQWADAPEGVALEIDPKVTTGHLVASALQAAAKDATQVLVRPRTGYLEDNGKVYYLTTTGGLTSDGLSKRCRADVDYPLDFSPGLEGDPVAAWRKAMSIANRIVDPTPYLAAVAWGAGVVAGAPPQGCLALVGGPSAGKTTLLRAALAIYGGIEATWSGTELARGALLSGCHQAVGLVDDIPPKTSEREQVRQLNSLDQLLRRGYDPRSGARRLQLAETRPSGTKLAPLDLSAPGICISLEAIPDGLPPSARERMLVWEVSKDSTWREDMWELTKTDWMGTDLPITAGAHLVMSIVGSIEAFGGLEPWLDKISTASASTKVGKQVMASVDARLRDKLYSYWVGLDILLAAWENMGVPDKEIEEWGYMVQEALLTWSRGTRAADRADSWSGRLLESIQAAIISGKAVVADHEAAVAPGATRIGWTVQKGVALLPVQVAQVLGLSADVVRQGLAALCGPTRTQRFGDQVVRAYLVPAEKWWPDGRQQSNDQSW